ncbi:SesA protein [Xylariaceae sp. FL0662B]|nr:SesA protein [Xylariaceae sp. FL0662B]
MSNRLSIRRIMTRNEPFNKLITDTIATLKAAAEAYQPMKDDGDLLATFHKACQQLNFVVQTLEAVESRLKSRNLAQGIENATRSLEDSNRMAKTLEGILRDVASAPETSRNNRYLGVVRQKGPGSSVEELMLSIMEKTQALAMDDVIRADMETQACYLQEAIKELEAMDPSAPTHDSGTSFSHSGSGSQFNNTGRGRQFNNTGTGRQYQAETMNFKD